jgi:hypothetical protein
MLFFRKAFLLISFLLALYILQAQEEVQDIQFWSSVQFNVDLPKRFSASVQYQIRLDNNISSIKGSYLSVGVGYEIIKKYLSGEVDYRYVASTKNDRHRFGFGLTGKYKTGKVGFSNRLLYQREHEYFNAAYEGGHEPTNYLRNRFQVKVDLPKRFDVYASIEPFVRFSNKFNDVDRIRTITGVDWEFVKNHSFSLFYLFQADVNVKNPGMGHVFGLNYEWNIPKFKKKKKRKP